MSLLEKAFTWPPDQTWNFSGPNSGGGQTLYLSMKRLFDTATAMKQRAPRAS